MLNRARPGAAARSVVDPIGRLAEIEEARRMLAHPTAATGRARRPAGEASGTAGESLLPVLMTEHGGRVSHVVTEDQLTAPVRGTDPQSLCGIVFTPAALTTPPGPICAACLDRLRPATQASRSRPWRRHRHSTPGSRSAIPVAGRP